MEIYNNIIKRDGNLVEVDFRKKNKDSKEHLTGITVTVAIPALIAGGATPFLNPENNDKFEAEKPLEYKLSNNPVHHAKSPQDLINDFRSRNPLSCSYVEMLTQFEKDSAKTR